jgi:hypothetical protein
MKRHIRYLALAVGIVWPVSGFAQSQPTPSREQAELNAFYTPTTGRSDREHGEPAFARDKSPLAGSQGPATNPEGKNITEPEADPSTPSPNGLAKR